MSDTNTSTLTPEQEAERQRVLEAYAKVKEIQAQEAAQAALAESEGTDTGDDEIPAYSEALAFIKDVKTELTKVLKSSDIKGISDMEYSPRILTDNAGTYIHIQFYPNTEKGFDEHGRPIALVIGWPTLYTYFKAISPQYSYEKAIIYCRAYCYDNFKAWYLKKFPET